MKFSRYAIYYAPPPKAEWARFATGWLGWDMQAGQGAGHPHLPDLPMPLADITRSPRKYGLHATLKPPFRLADGMSQDNLETACADLCRTLGPLTLEPLRLTRLGRFLALCPPASLGLSELAAACVRDLDRLRAPPSQAELDRRRAANLTSRQEANLIAWGYPHVLEDFRFHVTLTGRLAKPDLSAVQKVLQRNLTPLLPTSFTVSDLALTGEDADGRFHLVRRFQLSGCHASPV